MITKVASRQTINLQEHVMAAPAGRVDRIGGFIRGVKILGRVSKNGREYSDQALREAAALYEGMAVNANHPDRDTPGRNRSVEEGIGWLENVKVKSDGVYGDLAVIKAHPMAESIFEAAERNPRRFGLSHNAEGSTIQRGGKIIVESIVRVRSVDLVQNPATNQSLFESYDPMSHTTHRKTTRLTENVKLIVSDRSITRRLKIRLLTETMDGPPPTGPENMADAVDVSPAVQDLADQIVGILQDKTISRADKIEAIKEIVNAMPVEAADDVPVGAEAMAESYSDPRGYTRAKRESVRDGAAKMIKRLR